MQYLCNKHGLDQFYPTDPGERAMVDSAMFYLIGTLYPLVARATYPALGFPQYPGEVGDVGRPTTRSRRRRSGTPRRRSPSRSTRTARSSSTASTSSAATRPSIADIRLCGDARVPAGDRLRLPGAGRASTWSAMESALGDAYSEPAARRARVHRVREVAGRLGQLEVAAAVGVRDPDAGRLRLGLEHHAAVRDEVGAEGRRQPLSARSAATASAGVRGSGSRPGSSSVLPSVGGGGSARASRPARMPATSAASAS